MVRRLIVFTSMFVALSSSLSAYAWGQREQDALRGLVAGWLLHSQFNKGTVRYENDERVVYRNPQRTRGSFRQSLLRCYENPYCDNLRLARAYERGREQRRREIEAQLEREAYDRGYRDN